jgi:hypothetical protein
MEHLATELFELEQAPGLREFVEELFRFESERARRARDAMAYQFSPERQFFSFHGLTFEAILNRSRYDYVRESLGKLAEAERGRDRAEDARVENEQVGRGQAPWKRSLLPHRPPPGLSACPLDDLANNHRLLARLTCGQKEYGLLVNSRPWGHEQTMLVTFDREPQLMTERELLASLLLLWNLGPEYEGIFTGVLAGASVYHFHLQVHRGRSVIWRNLEGGNLRLDEICSSAAVRACAVDGWPALFFAFEGSDCSRLAAEVSRMIDILARGDNDYPYNLGFRRVGDQIRLVLFPRGGEGEKPASVNPYPDSWGRFSFLEMGGGIYLLTPEGYEATVRSPEGLYDAIAQMSVPPSDFASLVGAFQAGCDPKG